MLLRKSHSYMEFSAQDASFSLYNATVCLGNSTNSEELLALRTHRRLLEKASNSGQDVAYKTISNLPSLFPILSSPYISQYHWFPFQLAWQQEFFCPGYMPFDPIVTTKLDHIELWNWEIFPTDKGTDDTYFLLVFVYRGILLPLKLFWFAEHCKPIFQSF